MFNRSFNNLCVVQTTAAQVFNRSFNLCVVQTTAAQAFNRSFNLCVVQTTAAQAFNRSFNMLCVVQNTQHRCSTGPLTCCVWCNLISADQVNAAASFSPLQIACTGRTPIIIITSPVPPWIIKFPSSATR